MVNNKALAVARYAIMLATIFVATLIDRSITLGLPIAGATVELLVTFAFCFLYDSWIDGFLASTFMGLSSFILAFPFGKIASQNPAISIVPRLFVSILAFCLYKLILLITKKVKNKYVCQVTAMVMATFVGLLTNTILYMGALSLFTDQYGSFVLALQAVAVLNCLPEYLVSLVCVSPIVLGVRHGLKLGIDGNNWKRVYKTNKSDVDVTEGNGVALVESEGQALRHDVSTETVKPTKNDDENIKNSEENINGEEK
ncbi:MAG: hypothetical protein NC132_00805 [Corallococcus sp.]|nr:hypothetical protein [Corallococcus sp.]MCM1359256.1 hypothetical protein [Corallococcus sp.]MCM1394647.1 hypothetical protein [Corallococcus sp.]